MKYGDNVTTLSSSFLFYHLLTFKTVHILIEISISLPSSSPYCNTMQLQYGTLNEDIPYFLPISLCFWVRVRVNVVGTSFYVYVTFSPDDS